MAYSTINKSTLHQNTVIYSGDDATTRNITGFGFQPDLIWNKSRSTTYNHYLVDAVRGSPGKVLISNLTNAEDNDSGFQNSFKGFVADGNTIGQVSGYEVNDSGVDYVEWGWKAGTTGSGTTTGSGSYKSYSYSVNTTAGFSIVKYIGNGSAGHTIPHHLGAAAKWIIVKKQEHAKDWNVYHSAMGATKGMYLNLTNAQQTHTNWNNTHPTSTVFSLGSDDQVNGNDNSYIAYCFAEKQGYSKFSSYEGNSSSDGVFVYTGFKPNFVMVKNISAGQSWWMWDNKRLGYNSSNYRLRPDTNGAESSDNKVDFVSNGFKFRDGDNAWNYSGNTFIYMAFGQSLVGSNDTPCTAR